MIYSHPSRSHGTSRRARLIAAPGASLWLSLVVGLAIAAGGCSSSLTTRPADVTITTPQGTPVAGAIVRADPIDPHHPLNIGDYFKGEPSTLGSWRTDGNGHASITLMRDRPTAVTFTAVGFALDSALVEASRPAQLRFTLTPLPGESSNPR